MRPIDADELRKSLLTITCYHLPDALKFDFLIEQQPTIDPKDLIPHGWWEEKEDEYLETYVQCSNCKYELGVSSWLSVEEFTQDINYCPNCGAKMDKEA